MHDNVVRLSDSAATVDASRIGGEVTLALRQRPAIGASLRIDHLNLDAYLTGLTLSEPPFAWLSRLDDTADIGVGKLTWRPLPVDHARIDGALRHGVLDVRQLAADGPESGDRVRLNGRIDGRVWPLGLDLNGELALADPVKSDPALGCGHAGSAGRF